MSNARPEVLVIEEEDAVRGVIAAILNEHGCDVRLADSGPDAVNVYAKHRSTIDAVLLDVGMEGMDGPATLIALQRINPHVRCNFMTGGGGRYDDTSLVALGAVCVLQKPFETIELEKVLEQIARDLLQAAG